MKKLTAAVAMLAAVSPASAASQANVPLGPGGLVVFLAILAPFAASLLTFTLYRRLGDGVAYLGASSALVSLLSVTALVGTKGTVSLSWLPALGIAAEFYVDGLSLLIASLASGIGILVFLYSRAYMDHGDRKRKYYTVLTAFMGSMIGLVFASNLIVLFLFWELTSVCSFLLISHSQRTKSGILASKKSLLLTVGSGLMLLIGFLVIESAAGTFSLAEMLAAGELQSTLVSQGLYVPVLALLGVGAAAKSAQVPLHIWLPDAMEAPTPVSAFLHSATMVKAGVYLIGRFRPLLMNGESWSLLFVSLGLVTMTVAGILAVAAEELKELLAYSTASHLGLIVAGFGFSSVLGAETASFHILNHAVFKASLFMIAGVVLHEAGTQSISELSGLRHDWPLLAGFATLAGLSMAGIPPLNGFFSKELLFESAYHAASHSGGVLWLLPVLAVFGSVFTFLYSVRFMSVFYGERSVETHEVPRLMLYAPGALAVLALVIGLFPNRFIDLLIDPALHSVSGSAHGMRVHLPAKLKPAFVMSILTVGTGALAYTRIERIVEGIRAVLEKRYFRSNYYYRSLLQKSDALSDFAVEKIESGLLRTYAFWVVTVASFLGLAGYLASGSMPPIPISATAPLSIVLATAAASAYAVLRSESYTSSVLTLSILGFMVSIYYLLMDAPDLVMTQLVVETLSLIIFLLVLDRLPEFEKKVSFSRKARDIALSVFAGATVFASVLYSTAQKTPGGVAGYYVENAVPGSGGGNVVNVILVDFRGIDTLGEISVIAMAGLAVLMLFRMRGDRE